MPRFQRLHAASSAAALLGAAVVFVGCEEGDEDLSAVDGQFQTSETDLDEMDPNELPERVVGDDETLGDPRLNDTTPEEPGVNEYDDTPLTPGDADD